MPRICKVTIDNETIRAKCGDLLLDAALMNGIELPIAGPAIAAPAKCASLPAVVSEPQPAPPTSFTPAKHA